MNQCTLQWLYPAYITTLIMIGSFILVRVILYPLVVAKLDRLDFDKAMDILESIINIELDLYENDIFSKQETITNAQYENYIEEILEHIEGAITPNLMNSITRYMTEDEVYTRIVRLVRRYIDSKAIIDYEDDEE